MAKKTIKIEQVKDIQVGDKIGGLTVRPNPRGWGKRFLETPDPHFPWIPLDLMIPIVKALCESGHVTREVEPALMWTSYGDCHNLYVDGVFCGKCWPQGFTVCNKDYMGIIEARFDELFGPKLEDPITTDDRYWDCNCKDRYIHDGSVDTDCLMCGATHEEQPDSRVNEIANPELHAPKLEWYGSDKYPSLIADGESVGWCHAKCCVIHDPKYADILKSKFISMRGEK